MSAYEAGVIHSGYLEKKGDMRWQQRWFELHGDRLVYTTNKGDKPRGEMELNSSATVSSLSSADPLGFQVIFSGGKALKVDTSEILRHLKP